MIWTVVIPGSVVLLLVGAQLIHSQGPVVATQYGRIRGKVEQYGDIKMNVFLGIPYAAPPTGPRRFQQPMAPVPWSDVRNAVSFGNACPQQGQSSFHEDCLFLNVYTLQVSSPSLPVMVYIHGGAYVMGSGQADAFMIARKGVVVVLINYRLGALGFLSTQDTVCPGNNGMLDQVFALQWVKKNIAAFGGNASSVTIFGESAGSSSVSLHLLSPLSRGLFHGALMESGVSLSPWAVGKLTGHPAPRERAFLLGTQLGCTNKTSLELLECLRRADAGRVINITVPAPTEHLQWYPVVETINGFLPDSPASLLKAGKIANVPTLRGTNDLEGSLIFMAVPGINSGVSLPYLLLAIHNFVVEHYGTNPNKTKIENAFKAVYAAPANVTNNSTIRTSLIRTLSDFLFTAPTTLETQLTARHSDHAPRYMYLFSYRSQLDPLPSWMGVPHAGELAYVIGAPMFSGSSYTQADRNFSDNLITMWTNFAKFGNPTPHPVAGITWPSFTSLQQNYLSLGNQIVVEQNLRPEEAKLWNEIIPNLAPDS